MGKEIKECLESVMIFCARGRLFLALQVLELAMTVTSHAFARHYLVHLTFSEREWWLMAMYSSLKCYE